MGKASRAKRPGGRAPAVATRATVGTGSSRRERRASAAAGVSPVAHDGILAHWGIGLTAIAGIVWLLGHLPAIAPLAIPIWIITGLAVGLVQPWLGLLLTIAVVPFLGGAIDDQSGEVLRVVPIYGAAARVLFDRFLVGPAIGRAVRQGPPWWVVAAAIAATGLYAYTAQTAAVAVGEGSPYLDVGLHWLAGGPMAMMAAWIAASHLVAGRDRTLTGVVLGTTAIGCVLALVAWIGVPGVDLITFPGIVDGRLGALGYPTPTAMGIATALPLAVAAALRRGRWLTFGIIGLALVTLLLTWSRGPLIAIGVGAVLAVLASGHVERRLRIAGLAVGAVTLVALVAVRYGTNVSAVISAISGSSGEDVDRVNTWIAAVSIAIGSPLVGGGWRSLERFGDFAQREIVYSHDILLHGFSEGGFPLGITNATVILYSAWQVWRRRHTMAPYLIAAVAVFLVCGFWDIPQVRSYAAVMGGIVLGMAAGPLVGREPGPARTAA
jgi:O-Antigen ligase